jgi:hypothetical protein
MKYFKTNFHIADRHYERYLFDKKLSNQQIYYKLRKLFLFLHSDSVGDDAKLPTYYHRYHFAFKGCWSLYKPNKEMTNIKLIEKDIIDSIVEDLINGLPNLANYKDILIGNKNEEGKFTPNDRYSPTQIERIEKFTKFMIIKQYKLSLKKQ